MPAPSVRKFGKSAVTPPNLTPMIDVIFQLLIYFLLTAAMVEGGLQVQIPKSKAATSSKPSGVYLAVDEQGLILYKDKSYADVDALKTALTREPDKKRAVIRAHKDIRYHTLMSVMDACKLSGFEKISLAVQPGAAPAQAKQSVK